MLDRDCPPINCATSSVTARRVLEGASDDRRRHPPRDVIPDASTLGDGQRNRDYVESVYEICPGIGLRHSAAGSSGQSDAEQREVRGLPNSVAFAPQLSPRYSPRDDRRIRSGGQQSLTHNSFTRWIA